MTAPPTSQATTDSGRQTMRSHRISNDALSILVATGFRVRATPQGQHAKWPKCKKAVITPQASSFISASSAASSPSSSACAHGTLDASLVPEPAVEERKGATAQIDPSPPAAAGVPPVKKVRFTIDDEEMRHIIEYAHELMRRSPQARGLVVALPAGPTLPRLVPLAMPLTPSASLPPRRPRTPPPQDLPPWPPLRFLEGCDDDDDAAAAAAGEALAERLAPTAPSLPSILVRPPRKAKKDAIALAQKFWEGEAILLRLVPETRRARTAAAIKQNRLDFGDPAFFQRPDVRFAEPSGLEALRRQANPAKALPDSAAGIKLFSLELSYASIIVKRLIGSRHQASQISSIEMIQYARGRRSLDTASSWGAA
ncbi:hypothetical protein BDZ90DRAFT_260361 [Jaminaea rosea]|uniref:Uncharacterized protein n=1 Tax=Jaminaea rosea TaxID=1569628 RepID=A0A316USA9_9BASI|nr:hypothetical protein BDZ90DRAFT_260361 [Jaminaea rosea]PWN27874.1 hypothetical protein BDZ90DRAFT_260361 [Jaminaea rosea]